MGLWLPLDRSVPVILVSLLVAGSPRCHRVQSTLPHAISGSNQQEALLVLLAECRERGKEAHRRARVIVPWAENVKIDFEFSDTRIELPNHEWSDRLAWGDYGSDILTPEGRFPIEFLAQGLISFDGSHVSETVKLPSMIRSSTGVTLPKRFRVNDVEFRNCAYYFQYTDFGKRKTFSCDQVGVIAEDEDLSVERAPRADWVPSLRVVAAERLAGEYPKFSIGHEHPPYHAKLLAELERFSHDRDFFPACQEPFERFIRLKR